MHVVPYAILTGDDSTLCAEKMIEPMLYSRLLMDNELLACWGDRTDRVIKI